MANIQRFFAKKKSGCKVADLSPDPTFSENNPPQMVPMDENFMFVSRVWAAWILQMQICIPEKKGLLQEDSEYTP